MNLVIEKLQPDGEQLRQGFTPDIYATDRALELAASGKPFRDAYREIGGDLESLEQLDPDQVIRSRTYTGTTGNLGLEPAFEQVRLRREQLVSHRQGIDRKLEALVGSAIGLA
jgi:argininosuccinate lyase